jgi:hypothetical protein
MDYERIYQRQDRLETYKGVAIISSFVPMDDNDIDRFNELLLILLLQYKIEKIVNPFPISEKRLKYLERMREVLILDKAFQDSLPQDFFERKIIYDFYGVCSIANIESETNLLFAIVSDYTMFPQLDVLKHPYFYVRLASSYYLSFPFLKLSISFVDAVPFVNYLILSKKIDWIESPEEFKFQETRCYFNWC